jgi:hypothetical protein
MAYKAEDIVNVLAGNPSMFSLSGDEPVFAQGFADLVTRMQKAEASLVVLQQQVAAMGALPKQPPSGDAQ